MVGGAVSLLASTLLHVFPNTFADATHVEYPQVGAPLVRQAIDFIQVNCARDISMADIASAINVTPPEPCNTCSGGTSTPPRWHICAGSA